MGTSAETTNGKPINTAMVQERVRSWIREDDCCGGAGGGAGGGGGASVADVADDEAVDVVITEGEITPSASGNGGGYRCGSLMASAVNSSIRYLC